MKVVEGCLLNNAVDDQFFVNSLNESAKEIDRMLSRSLTHKKRTENAYCTSISKLSENIFSVGAFIPKTNIFFQQCHEDIESNILLLTEIGRQAAIAVSHKYLGVELDQTFVLDQLNMQMLPQISPNDDPVSDLIMQVILCGQENNSSGRLSAVTTRFEASNGREKIAEGQGDWSFWDNKRYQRLRTITRRRVEKKSSGKSMIENMLQLTPLDYSKVLKDIYKRDNETYISELYIYPKHIFFFEHDCDHVPGMLILEGFKQLASRALEHTLNLPVYSIQANQISLTFKNFAELDFPVLIKASTNTESDLTDDNKQKHVKVQALQSGQLMAEAVLGLKLKDNPIG